MTRLAIISDVHADVYALQDALVQIARLGCERIVCAGDLVDYGLFPDETLALLRERNIPCIRGNHDRWAVGRGSADAPAAGGRGGARDATGWDLSPASLRFLRDLPIVWNVSIEGVRVAVRHGTPRSDMEGIHPDHVDEVRLRRFLAEVDADVLIVGHTHVAFAISVPEGLVANPGALLRDPAVPMDGTPWLIDETSGLAVPMPGHSGGTFGVLELPQKRFTVHRAADGQEVEVLRGLPTKRRSDRA